MKISALVVFGSMALACGGNGAMAGTFAINGLTFNTEYNTGSGVDHALMVLEYSATAKYTFGYSWDPAGGSASGFNMLSAVAANSGGNMTLSVSYTDFHDGNGLQPFVETVGYLSYQPTLDYQNSWFSYFTSDAGSDWTGSWVGANLRSLADGSADDWVFQNVPPDENYNPQVLPEVAISTPEPCALGMVGLGLITILRRRRMSR